SSTSSASTKAQASTGASALPSPTSPATRPPSDDPRSRGAVRHHRRRRGPRETTPVLTRASEAATGATTGRSRRRPAPSSAAYGLPDPGPEDGSDRDHSAGEVAVAPVADHEDDRRVLDLLGDLQGGPARAGCGDASEDAFLAGEPTGHLLGVGLGDLDGPVHG